MTLEEAFDFVHYKVPPLGDPQWMESTTLIECGRRVVVAIRDALVDEVVREMREAGEL